MKSKIQDSSICEQATQYQKTNKQEMIKTQITKTLKLAFLMLVSIAIFSCSKDEDEPIPAAIVVDNKLKLPATFDNNTLLTVPDAVKVTAECGSGTTPGTAQNTIVIDKEGIIYDEDKITFEIDLEAKYAGEVVVEIISTSTTLNGNSISLIKRINATSSINCGTNLSFIAGNKLSFNNTFTQAMSLNGGAGAPIAAGNYKCSRGTDNFPSQVSDGNFGNFLRNQTVKGTWTIKVYDCGVGDRVKLNGWKIKFDVGALR